MINNRKIDKKKQQIISEIKLRLQNELLNTNHTINSARKTFDDIYLSYSDHLDIKKEKKIINKIKTVSFIPNNAKRTPLIIFLHGGGFTLGSTKGHSDFISKLALQTKITTLSIEYRLSPEHPYPAPVYDCINVYQTLLETYQSNNIIWVGMTAGATILLSSMLTLKKKLPQPRAIVCISPPVDLTFDNPSIHKNKNKDWILKSRLLSVQSSYLKNTSPKDPIASPYFADLTNLPPMLIQVGSCELLIDDIIKFSDKAKKSGIDIELQIWKDMIHGWHMFSSIIEDGTQATNAIVEYICSHFAKH